MKKENKLRKVVIFIMVIIITATIIPGRTIQVQAASTCDPFVGQICLFPYNRVPLGWVECDGRQMYIQQNQALYASIGATFGGNGSTYFNVPNLSNKAPIPGTKYYMATQGLYGVDSAMPMVGEVCLIPDSMFHGASDVWRLCDGASLNTSEYSTLNSLIGSSYGGNGSTSFNVPNLSKRNPINGLHYYIAINGDYPFQDSPPVNDSLIGSIELYAFSFIPGGALYCNGQTIMTNYNNALYSLIGNNFSGTASNFGIPNLIRNVPSLRMKYCIRSTGIYPSFN